MQSNSTPPRAKVQTDIDTPPAVPRVLVHNVDDAQLEDLRRAHPGLTIKRATAEQTAQQAAQLERAPGAYQASPETRKAAARILQEARAKQNKQAASKPAPFARAMLRPDLDIPEPPPFAGGEQEDPGPIVQPHNREAEEAVLGSVIIRESIAGLMDMLHPADFFIRRHGWIWTAFLNLAARGVHIDYLTTCDELRRLGQLEDAGGPAYLTVLVNQVPSSLNAETYAALVRDCAARRGLIAAAEHIATLAMNPKRSIYDVITGSLEAVHSQTQEADNQRYTVRNAAFAMQEQPPIDYLVDGLITAGSVNVFYGEAGSKKSYSALSLAVCVASGRQWLEYATKQSPVLFIDEESGERRFARRLQAAMRGELCQDERLPIDFVSLAGFKLDEDADPVILEALVQACGARLVIIDALADVMTGDENDKAAVQPVFNHLRKISERTDCAVLLIHHAGKAGGYRGSSAIKGAVDLMVQISSENGSDFVNFKSEKNRDGGIATWAARATWIEGQFDMQPAEHTQGNKPPSASQAYVLRYLTAHGPAVIEDIKGAADTCSAEAARKAVYTLAEAGKIKRTDPGGKGSKAEYGLSE